MLRRPIAALAACCAFVLVGCAPQRVWTKPGASEQDFKVDAYNCERDARQSGYFGTGLVGQINFNDFQQRCMEAHGWALGPAFGSYASNTKTKPDALHECGDEAEKEANTRNSFDPTYKKVFDRCMRNSGSL